MQKQSEFLKKVDLKKRTVPLDFEKISKESKSKHNLQPLHLHLKKQDLSEFQIIGIFDKKVIVAYHNGLQLFGYFDFHAVHERIRYEYYSLKLKQTVFKNVNERFFDEDVIEKGGKPVRQIFGESKKCLLRVQKSTLSFFDGETKNTKIWGIQLSKNSIDEVFVTSFSSILGKDLNFSEISAVLKEELIFRGKKVPTVIDDWVGEFSCKSAYKFNDTLPLDIGKKLIKNLQKCQFPWFCVHGRNTIHVSLSQTIIK